MATLSMNAIDKTLKGHSQSSATRRGEKRDRQSMDPWGRLSMIGKSMAIQERLWAEEYAPATDLAEENAREAHSPGSRDKRAVYGSEVQAVMATSHLQNPASRVLRTYEGPGTCRGLQGSQGISRRPRKGDEQFREPDKL